MRGHFRSEPEVAARGRYYCIKNYKRAYFGELSKNVHVLSKCTSFIVISDKSTIPLLPNKDTL